MKFKLNEFKLCGVNDMSHFKFTIEVSGNHIERDITINTNNNEDVELLEAIEKFINKEVVK